MNQSNLSSASASSSDSGLDEWGPSERVAPVKILIQDQSTRLYFTEFNGWSSELEHAQDFKHVAGAVRHVVRTGLGAVDVLMHFENSRYDVRLPLCGPSKTR